MANKSKSRRSHQLEVYTEKQQRKPLSSQSRFTDAERKKEATDNHTVGGF